MKIPAGVINKKYLLKKRIVLILAAVLVMSLALSSCSKEDSTTVMTFRDAELSKGMFSFMMASQKAYVKYVFESYTSDYYYENGSYPYGTDIFDDFLALTMPEGEGKGLTYALNAYNTVVNTAKMFVVVNHFCEKYNLVVTDKDVINDIEQAVAADIDTAGGVVLLNEILEKFDANVNTAREYLYNMAKVDLLYDYLYGDRGTQRVADLLVSDKFGKEYRKIDFVYYPYFTISSETGERVFYDEQKKSDIRSKADDFFAKLQSGEVTFEDYSEHDDYARYDEGICYTSGTLEREIEEQADKLENYGDIAQADTGDGLYIIRLVETTNEDYLSKYDTVYTVLAKDAYYKYIESFYNEITVDSAVLSEYDFATYPPLVIE